MDKFTRFIKWVTWCTVFFVLGWGTRFIPEFDIGQAQSQQTINNSVVRRLNMLEWNENKWEYNDMILLKEIRKAQQSQQKQQNQETSDFYTSR